MPDRTPPPALAPVTAFPEHFPLARYRLEWRATTPLRLPDYAGSMLRGAFGHALRQLACMTRQKECDGCPLLPQCPYPAIFAPPPPAAHRLQKFSAIPVPYVIEAPESGARRLEAGEGFAFHLVLVGRALSELPLILLAWRRALLRGIGAGDGRAELERVVHCGETADLEVHRPDGGGILAHDARVGRCTAAASEATLCFFTPLRLQENGRALPPHRLDATRLLMALVRRIDLLAEFHAGGTLNPDFSALRAAAEALEEERRLVWRDWTRYSSRQGQKMALGGVVGDWRLVGDLTPFVPYLRLGEYLHVGKEAVFGLGRFTLEGRTIGHNLAGHASFRDSPPEAIEISRETGPAQSA